VLPALCDVTLLGGLAGLAGWLATRGWPGIAIVLLSGAVAVVVAGYVAASRREIDATTKVAALIVIAAGDLPALMAGDRERRGFHGASPGRKVAVHVRGPSR
jgi:hypothetical protein